MTQRELKPCPFCGCGANPMGLQVNLVQEGRQVGCWLCGARGPWCSDYKEATRRWNTRLAEPGVEPEGKGCNAK